MYKVRWHTHLIHHFNSNPSIILSQNWKKSYWLERFSRDFEETRRALARRGSEYYGRPHVAVLELERAAKKNVKITLYLRTF